MRNYINSDTVTRTWIHIQKEDGSTLELDPGKSVDLDTCTMYQLAKSGEWKVAPITDFEDPYLVPSPFAAEKKARKMPEPVQEQSVNA